MDRARVKRSKASRSGEWGVLWCVGAVVLLFWVSGCNTNSLSRASCFSADDCTEGTRCVDGYCIGGEGVWSACHDVDGDGYFVEEGCGTKADCDDSDPATHPGAEEACDLVDNDCDGETDEAFPGLGEPCTAGKGICRAEGETVCNPDETGTTCNAQTPPPEEERCNGKDDNCNGVVDDLPGEMDVGNPQTNVTSCGRCGIDCRATIAHASVDCQMGVCTLETCESPWVDLNDDASDGCEYECGGKRVAEMNGEPLPADDVRCDGLDDDCDGAVDEDVPKLGDDCASGQGACRTEGTVVCSKNGPGTICDAEPGSSTAETCNGKDDDCDGEVDEDPTDGNTWYRDRDGDGHGDPNTTQRVCANKQPPQGYIQKGGDCRDGNAKIHPGAMERCNGKDDDCDGKTDEGLATTTFYRDRDGDGFGDPNASRTSCRKPSRGRWVTNRRDCDDSNRKVRPNGTEVCDGLDNDCNGKVDDGVGPKKCSNQQGVCSGSTVACQNGRYPNCGPVEYGDGYQSTESSCDDNSDNDCDGQTDCRGSNADSDCSCN